MIQVDCTSGDVKTAWDTVLAAEAGAVSKVLNCLSNSNDPSSANALSPGDACVMVCDADHVTVTDGHVTCHASDGTVSHLVPDCTDIKGKTYLP